MFLRLKFGFQNPIPARLCALRAWQVLAFICSENWRIFKVALEISAKVANNNFMIARTISEYIKNCMNEYFSVAVFRKAYWLQQQQS